MPVAAKNLPDSVPLAIVPWNWLKVWQSGLIAGVILFFLPQGEPWAGLNFYSGAIMGRVPDFEGGGPSLAGTLWHFILASLYSFLVISATRYWRLWRGMLVGCLMGGLCYAINWTLARFLAPAYEGHEGRVIVTHLLYGLYVSAIYKGLTVERVQGIVQPH